MARAFYNKDEVDNIISNIRTETENLINDRLNMSESGSGNSSEINFDGTKFKFTTIPESEL